MDEEPHAPLWRTRGGIVLIGFLVVAGFYLLTEHTAHLLGALPLLLFLSCPLMHLFMHHGHGGHHARDGASEARPDKASEPARSSGDAP
jgi:DUF2933 family protein